MHPANKIGSFLVRQVENSVSDFFITLRTDSSTGSLVKSWPIAERKLYWMIRSSKSKTDSAVRALCETKFETLPKLITAMLPKGSHQINGEQMMTLCSVIRCAWRVRAC